MRLRRCDRLPDVDANLHAQLARDTDDDADVLPDLLRIDVNGTDDADALPRGDLLGHGRADWAQTNVKDADHGAIMVRACRERSYNSLTTSGLLMHTLRPFAAALLLCGPIVAPLPARQQTPVEQPPADEATSARAIGAVV